MTRKLTAKQISALIEGGMIKDLQVTEVKASTSPWDIVQKFSRTGFNDEPDRRSTLKITASFAGYPIRCECPGEEEPSCDDLCQSLRSFFAPRKDDLVKEALVEKIQGLLDDLSNHQKLQLSSLIGA